MNNQYVFFLTEGNVPLNGGSLPKYKHCEIKVDYNDPYVPMTRKMRHYDLKMSSVPLTEKNLEKYDCVVISTDHSSYDYSFIAKHSRLVVDTRNAMKGVSGSARGNIIKA